MIPVSVSQFQNEECFYAPHNVSKLIHEFFEYKRFTGEKIIEWPLSSSDLNLVKNLWSLVKMKSYVGVKQYNSLADFWEAIKSTISEINKINGSLADIEKKPHYIEM